ncbi:nucleotidyltransferase domain-containing protein [Ruania halotolerans]|uniref:nucleotidyltransferase domain-containing protein n=1 Tax=Ruania halotolerans TaxID=2897773 RepID=UPI001E4C0C7D|nr:nucleotidyltransferase domain-containing protein [Ruania halotolerans]UFU06122.1 nucleotidyltransferase domain-containing protein [Ruania halotolerans]
MQHHQETLAAFVERVRHDPDVEGVVLTGSVAHGTERPDSDVDVQLVLTEEAFARAWAQNRLSYVLSEVATYEGGYVDIKVASADFLRQAAESADDPMRHSMLGARVVWSRLHGLGELVAAIPVVPADRWNERMASFIAQARLHSGYFLKQAVQLENTHLLHHAAVHTVTAGGRALLALNRTLFKGHKYLEGMLAGLELVPTGYAEATIDLLANPGPRTCAAYMDLLESFHPWPLSREQTLSTFVRDNELGWYSGQLPPEYS